jgi:HAD superfamily hydrolase (TIGR01509 family)
VRTTVVFDVGETLVDETVLWESWARWLQVPEFTLYGVLGGLAATGRDHQEFVALLKPESSFAAELAARHAAGERWDLTADQLYPDAVACLEAVKADGWTVVVGGNQPPAVQQLIEELHLPVDVVISSGGLGAAKPDLAFFHAAAAAAGVTPEQCIHVGDRVDNDVVGARAAGMLAVHVRRGPWGVLHADDPAVDLQVTSLAELPALLRTLRTR